MRLLLVRHGQTSSNVGHHLDTAEPGADLTDLGRRQAEAVPAALAGERIDLVVVSTLVRTQQTAAPLVAERGLEPWVRPGIREISAGDLEMRNDAEAIAAYVEGVFGWGADMDVRVPGGESGHEVRRRYDEVVAEAAEQVGPDGTALFVSHGAVIRAWTAMRADVDFDFVSDHWLANTALVVLTGSPEEGWRVESWGETPLGGAHLADPEGTGPAGQPDDEAVEEAAEQG